jgi:hypothetical protein
LFYSRTFQSGTSRNSVANGAFDENEALNNYQLSEFKIVLNNRYKKIILTGWQIKTSPFPVALDEELIGVFGMQEKSNY